MRGYHRIVFCPPRDINNINGHNGVHGGKYVVARINMCVINICLFLHNPVWPVTGIF